MKETNVTYDSNLTRILGSIWKKKSISRIDIASSLDIDKSTVTKNVIKLKKLGIIRELAEGQAGPQGGRKPIFLEVIASFACVGGIEINSEYFICTIIDLQGEILFHYQKNIPTEIFSYLGCNNIFYEAHKIIIEEAKRLNRPIIAIGIGLPGLVDSEKGTIIQSKSIFIHEEYAFLKDIQQLTNIPLFIENDARCCCYSEKIIRRDEIIKDMIFLLIEFRLTEPIPVAKKNLAIGIGLILDEKIFTGSHFLSGEFRSMLWEKGLEGQFKAQITLDSANNIEEKSLRDSYKELAKHIAFLVNILNIQDVYIGGSLHKNNKELELEILKQIEYSNPYDIPNTCAIRTSSVGSLSVAYGAASMCLFKLFDSPIDSSIVQYLINLY